MTPSSHKLVLLILEHNRSVCKCLANYKLSSVAVISESQLTLTFIARNFSSNQISNLASRVQIRDIEICTDTCSEQTTRGYSETAAKINHGRNCAAMKDLEAVL